jgi:hypothetical protein
MPLNIGKEKLEQRKLFIIKSIEAIEQHSKLLQQKQALLQKRLDSLKFRKKLITRMINHHMEAKFPFMQIVNVEIKKGDEREFILYIN